MRRLLAGLVMMGASACVGIAEEDGVGVGILGPAATLKADGGVERGVDGGVDAGAPIVDPCASMSCPHGRCESTPGVAVCRCDAGFHADAGTCVIDDPCAGVSCGTNAHCQAGPCACDVGFEGDPAVHCTAIPGAQENTTRAQLVAIATAELDNCEGVNQRPYMNAQPGLWCYDFVAWVYTQASYSLPQPYYLPQYRVGHLPAGWRPKPGDLIKYTFQHFGMVETVSPDGQSITTLEGNVNRCVSRGGTPISALEYLGSLDSAF